MRKLICAFFVCAGLTASAQKLTQPRLGLGLGTAVNYFNGYKAGLGAGVKATLDFRIFDFSTGYLETGVALSYSSTSANLTVAGERMKYIWRQSFSGLRLHYVYPVQDNLEAYAGLSLGVRLISFEDRYSNMPRGYAQPVFNSFSHYKALYAGVNYKVSEKFFVFTELGNDVLWFSLGAKLQLK